ncbi:MAG: hypothetical protein J6Q83_05895 [Clostridia bacterium]|nr:hypothetical protein [Clostridia bacterium]
MEFLEAVLALILSMLSIFNIFDKPNHVQRPPSTQKFEYLEYPAEAIINPSRVGLSINEFTSRADDDGDGLYVNAQGYQDINGIIESPYFTVHVEREKIPVYATTVFVGTTQKGALHSFCEVYVDTSREISLEFQLNTRGFLMNKVDIYPSALSEKTSYLNNVFNSRITQLGTYTFIFNDTDQEHGFTLFVRELVDEDKEIAKYKAQYGENNVVVVEKGFHSEAAYYDFFGQSNTVYYLKRGAYLLAKHQYDINSDAENTGSSAPIDTDLYNAGHLPMGLNRCPYLNFNCCNNVKLVGNGVIDLSHLDRAERRGIVFAYSSNIEVNGVKFINSPEWTFITYDCENVTIKNVDIFGYRQNSDAFAICNTRNATIDNSFCRSGDDLFDVKAAGGRPEAISDNVTFTNCTAWNGKARCFGICGEVEKEIRNITFKDSSVIFHDATWDYNRIPTLAIVVEVPGGSISNVTFENINIHKTNTRAIGCLIYGSGVENFNISGIKYKNIRYNSSLPNKIASNGKTTNRLSVEFENVYANYKKINSVSSDNFEYDNYATISVK